MPFQATHLHYALLKMPELDIKDINKYLSGAVYPDSRYTTKIERDLTHAPSLFPEDVRNGSNPS